MRACVRGYLTRRAQEKSPNLEPSVDDHLVGLDCVTGVTGLEGLGGAIVVLGDHRALNHSADVAGLTAVTAHHGLDAA